ASGKQSRNRGEGTPGGGQGAAVAGQQHAARADVAVVWKLRPDKTLEPVRIRTGITDHTVTEVAQVLNGELNAQDELVTAATSGARRRGRAAETTAAQPRTSEHATRHGESNAGIARDERVGGRRAEW